jgi:predicted metal-dependent hydrolase
MMFSSAYNGDMAFYIDEEFYHRTGIHHVALKLREHPLDLRRLKSRWGNLLSSKVLDSTRVLINKIPF